MEKLITKRVHMLMPIWFAMLAALLYGISSPVSKMLLEKIPPTLMASFLYLGAGIGMFGVNLTYKFLGKQNTEAKVTSIDVPYMIGMIVLDIIAPILLMFGLTLTTSANASLLNNFEIVATSVIAMLIFKESISRRMWIAIMLITFSTMLLSFSDVSSFSFSIGSIFVVLACIAWGLENNCTRMLSIKDPLQIVVAKGFGSGIGALCIALFAHERSVEYLYIFYALCLGFVAYGLSIFFYIKAQRNLGAARTSAFYAAAPFIGALISWLLLREPITPTFSVALAVMIFGTYFAISDIQKQKK